MKRPVSGPWRLAQYRWRTNAEYQWKALRSALDWTVWLYIAIPALLLGIKFYYDWWTLPLPASWWPCRGKYGCCRSSCRC
ncbi:hypothetical protein [Paenibacillus thiaminolyticus]|uniref:hypothetical protein n=1 Tax=Paenibacillus thiaminolyticus TaxID=49283 RepID=UPI0021C4BB32|nr:hypothetical protein [Paenibacillus thiaminolyticus]CAH8705649.1 hypothetical protein KYE0_000524 [Paenibacillus thiaminolyticus]